MNFGIDTHGCAREGEGNSTYTRNLSRRLLSLEVTIPSRARRESWPFVLSLTRRVRTLPRTRRRAARRARSHNVDAGARGGAGARGRAPCAILRAVRAQNVFERTR